MLGVYSVSLDGQRSSLRVRGEDNLNPDGILRLFMTVYRVKGLELSNADLPYYLYQTPPIADLPPVMTMKLAKRITSWGSAFALFSEFNW